MLNCFNAHTFILNATGVIQIICSIHWWCVFFIIIQWYICCVYVVNIWRDVTVFSISAVLFPIQLSESIRHVSDHNMSFHNMVLCKNIFKRQLEFNYNLHTLNSFISQNSLLGKKWILIYVCKSAGGKQCQSLIDMLVPVLKRKGLDYHTDTHDNESTC